MKLQGAQHGQSQSTELALPEQGCRSVFKRRPRVGSHYRPHGLGQADPYWDECPFKSKKEVGPQPKYRELMGAVVLMSLKKFDYRQAEDMIAHYAPARYMCDLMDSTWEGQSKDEKSKNQVSAPYLEIWAPSLACKTKFCRPEMAPFYLDFWSKRVLLHLYEV